MDTQTFISILRWVFTIAGLVLFVISAWNLADARHDKRLLKEAKLNGFREIVADGNIRADGIKMFVGVVKLMIGLSAMIDLPRGVPTFVIAFGFVATTVLLAYDSVQSKIDRVRMIWKKENGSEGSPTSDGGNEAGGRADAALLAE